MGDFTEMSDHGFASSVANKAMRVFGRLSVMIAGKRDMFDSTVNACFFQGFEGSRLGMGQSVVDSAFREDPVTTPRPHEEEFGPARADAIANRCNLLATAKLTRPGSDQWRRQSLVGGN